LLDLILKELNSLFTSKVQSTWLLLFLIFDAILDQLTQIWIFHGCCNSFLIINLLVNCGESIYRSGND